MTQGSVVVLARQCVAQSGRALDGAGGDSGYGGERGSEAQGSTEAGRGK